MEDRPSADVRLTIVFFFLATIFQQRPQSPGSAILIRSKCRHIADTLPIATPLPIDLLTPSLSPAQLPGISFLSLLICLTSK